jgi:hypothetical protein
MQRNMVASCGGHDVPSDYENPSLVSRDSTQAVSAQPDFNQIDVKRYGASRYNEVLYMTSRSDS